MTHPRNVLRTILYVASASTVGRTELTRFQKQDLPEEDWDDINLYDWEPLTSILKWATVPTGESRSVPVRDLLKASAGDRGLSRDLHYFLEHGCSDPVLDATLMLPVTELGAMLGKRHTRATRSAYAEALRLASDPLEQDRFGGLMDFEAAERSLRQKLDEVTPTFVYEAVDLPALAKAILATREAAIERGDRFALITTFEHRAHRLYVISHLSKDQLAKALGVRPMTFQRSHLATRNFDPNINDSFEHLGSVGVEPKTLPVAEADLRLAMGSPSQRSW